MPRSSRPPRTAVTGGRITGSRIAIVTLCVAAAVASLPLRPHAAGVPDAVRRVLTQTFGFSSQEVADVDRGEPAARGLEVHDDREVSAVGAIRIEAPADFYVEQMKDIVRFKRLEAVQQIGVFGSPARPDDVSALTLDASDLKRLQSCRPDACDLNLSAEHIRLVQRSVDWSRRDAPAQAQQVFRRLLADMVRDYQTRGDAALMTYRSGERAVSMPEQFRALISSPPRLLDSFPRLREHLTRYPQAAGSDVHDLFYWSKEKIGPRVVVSVTHMAVARLPQGAAPVSYAAASRQIYGTQLFESSLGLTVLIDDPAVENRLYLVYANRSRVDALGGVLGPLKRVFVRARARATMAPTLRRAKVMVEQRFEATPRSESRSQARP